MTRKVFNFYNFSIVINAKVSFSVKPQKKKNCLNKHKHGYLIVNGFKGTVVNLALPFLPGGSLEITLTVQGIKRTH